jgi:hypothetical protein
MVTGMPSSYRFAVVWGVLTGVIVALWTRSRYSLEVHIALSVIVFTAVALSSAALQKRWARRRRR